MAEPSSGWGMLPTPLGFLRLEATATGISRVRFCSDAWDAGYPTPVVTAALRELSRYFGKPQARFESPLDPQGTPFQRRLWEALCRIPSGEVRTYGELARELGTSARAVGGACRSNPCLLLVPCHRVVAKHGLGGYAGTTADSGLFTKRWLLRHEGVSIG